MSEFLQGLLVAFIPSFIVSIATALVTVRLSIRQFYSQRWWEKKAEAYSSVIEQLSYLHLYYGRWFDHLVGNRQLDDEDKAQLEARYRQATESVEKATAAGAYILSDQAATALREMTDRLNQIDPFDPFEDVNKHYTAVKECIARMREYARADLKRR